MRGTTFPTRRPFYDLGAEHESNRCRQLIHERVRRAAAAALAELRARQQSFVDEILPARGAVEADAFSQPDAQRCEG